MRKLIPGAEREKMESKGRFSKMECRGSGEG
jgi:hypothetical protein